MSSQNVILSVKYVLRYFETGLCWIRRQFSGHCYPSSHAASPPPFQSVHSAFLLSQPQNSRTRLSTLPLTGNNLHIYGHATTGVTRRHGECLFRAGWGVNVGFTCWEETPLQLRFSNLLQSKGSTTPSVKYYPRTNSEVCRFDFLASPAHDSLAWCDPTAKQF